MRLFSLAAIALCGAITAGCATTTGGTSSALATSSKEGWGPHGKPLYYFFVLSNVKPGKEDEFNRWYDRIHVPIMIERGDFVWGQRFELSPSQFGLSDPQQKTHQHLVIFALETNDIDAAIVEANSRLRLPRNIASPDMDYAGLRSITWKALGPPTTQKEAVRLLDEEMAAGRVPKPGEAPAPGSFRRGPGSDSNP